MRIKTARSTPFTPSTITPPPTWSHARRRLPIRLLGALLLNRPRCLNSKSVSVTCFARIPGSRGLSATTSGRETERSVNTSARPQTGRCTARPAVGPDGELRAGYGVPELGMVSPDPMSPDPPKASPELGKVSPDPDLCPRSPDLELGMVSLDLWLSTASAGIRRKQMPAQRNRRS